MIKTYKGSCHCGDVQFEADLDFCSGSGKCNCSMCSKTRNWAIRVKPDAFRLLTERDALAHGNIPETGGEFYTVSLASLDGLSDDELAAIPVRFADGRDNNWMHPPPASHLQIIVNKLSADAFENKCCNIPVQGRIGLKK